MESKITDESKYLQGLDVGEYILFYLLGASLRWLSSTSLRISFLTGAAPAGSDLQAF